MANNHIKAIFDSTGSLVQINNLNSNVNSSIAQGFSVYNSFIGNNSKGEFQASGAYIFRPQSNIPSDLKVKEFTVYKGELFEEIHQVYNDWVSQTIRVYKDESVSVEFEWQVGPVNVDDKIGKEVVLKFKSDLRSDSLFYTDSNGREVLERRRDSRPSWNFSQTEKVAGNYYPVNSRIFLRDVKRGRQMTLVTDRSVGGSSIQDGSLEIMVHRRVLSDDALGVDEALNEMGRLAGLPLVRQHYF